MKCRTVSIRLEQPFAAIDEAAASEFLEAVRVRKVTASMRQGAEPAWSVLVFFEEAPARATSVEPGLPGSVAKGQPEEGRAVAGDETACPVVTKDEAQIALSPSQEKLVTDLKAWRSQRASQDKVPPYCVAQNRSLEDIARAKPVTQEELAAIKGFGPARLERYGSEILSLVSSDNGSGK